MTDTRAAEKRTQMILFDPDCGKVRNLLLPVKSLCASIGSPPTAAIFLLYVSERGENEVEECGCGGWLKGKARWSRFTNGTAPVMFGSGPRCCSQTSAPLKTKLTVACFTSKDVYSRVESGS